MTKFDLYVSLKELSEYFNLSEDYIRSQAQYEVLRTLNELEVISKSHYSRLSKVLYSQTPSLCVYTLESVQSYLRQVYDKREFMDKFLESSPSSIVQDLFTGVSYFRSDKIVDEYFQFVTDLQAELDYSVERVASEFKLEPVQMYSLIRHLNLRLKNMVGSKTSRKVYILPKVTYSTICAFLTQYTLVDLTTDLKLRLGNMGISPMTVKGVGTFVETSVLTYLQNSSKTNEIKEDGVSYIPLASFMLTYSLKPQDLTDSLKSLFVVNLYGTDEYVKLTFAKELETLKETYPHLDVRLLILVLGELTTLEEVKTYISTVELKAYFAKLLSLKPLGLNKSSYKYLAEGSKSELMKQMQLPFYSKESLLEVLRISAKGLPLDTEYKGYLNIYRLITFLNAATVSYPLPIYVSNKEGYLRVATNKESWNSLISISSNILLAPTVKIDSKLLSAYTRWEENMFESVKGEVERIIHG